MTVSRARVIPNSALADFCNKIDQEETHAPQVIRAKKRGHLADGLSENQSSVWFRQLCAWLFRPRGGQR